MHICKADISQAQPIYSNRNITTCSNILLKNTLELNLQKNNQFSFKATSRIKLKEYICKKQLEHRVNSAVSMYNSLVKKGKTLLFRGFSMESLEGLQHGIKVFEGLSMKDIQYLCENLHVIAVKRGCKNMCGYCYADAKQHNREMSWEDFTSITNGICEIRKRLHDLPIYGENHPIAKEHPIYRVTELFYDTDCMDLSIKDKEGNEYDFIDMLNEINKIGRKSCFDTSGWNPNLKTAQEKAEKYAQYFSKNENMDKLEVFDLSFNVFSASNVAAAKALAKGDIEKAKRLRGKYTDRIANALFTFTPLLEKRNFDILTRCFGVNAQNADGFDIETMLNFIYIVQEKLKVLYQKDLSGEQKYIKSETDIDKYMNLVIKKMSSIDTDLNSSGRMKQFMETFGIKAPLQNHSEITPYIIDDLSENGRYHRYIALRLIDTDGKVYHMDYARFIPTDIQLHLENKTPTPELANLVNNFKISQALINKKENVSHTFFFRF